MVDLTIEQQHEAVKARLDVKLEDIIATLHNPSAETIKAIDYLDELIRLDGKLTDARVTFLREAVYYIVVLYHTRSTLEDRELNFILDWELTEIL